LTAALHIEELRKTYRGPPMTEALKGLSLDVSHGEIVSFLGPNGAGKTTTIGICTTRLRPTKGRVSIAGLDVAKCGPRVRSLIGVVAQQGSLDLAITAFENLYYHCRYHGYSHEQSRQRATRALEQFRLVEKRDAKPITLSGGMQRRLQLARAISHEPLLLFLDEPTAGLDPQSRLDVWDLIREIRAAGHTVILTTHNLEEADTLSDRVAIIDHGALIGCDTPKSIRDRVAADTQVEIKLAGDATAAAGRLLQIDGVTSCTVHDGAVVALGRANTDFVARLLATVVDYGVRDVAIERPSLETAFIALTGRAPRA
jgi:ABC-2 type transport system ATP-binding protein